MSRSYIWNNDDEGARMTRLEEIRDTMKNKDNERDAPRERLELGLRYIMAQTHVPHIHDTASSLLALLSEITATDTLPEWYDNPPREISPAATPRTDAICADLAAEFPDPLTDGNKLLYYIAAAESYGQECAQLERELAEARSQLAEKDRVHDIALLRRVQMAEHERDALLEELIAARSAIAPPDMVLVPREPTEAMSQAYYKGIEGAGSLNFYPVWQNILAVISPSLPVEETATRILFTEDSYCPSCGHNRDTSSVSSIDNEDGTNTCQKCEATWTEVSNSHYMKGQP